MPPAEGTKAIDRDALQKAIAWMGQFNFATVESNEAKARVIAGARAYLATLPEPAKKWSVKAEGAADWVHFNSYDAAVKALLCEASAAKRAVTIEWREVTS